MVAGIAAADGHASMTWSGSATAGLARNGGAEATAATPAVANVAAITAHITLRNAATDGYGRTSAQVGSNSVSVVDPVGSAAITVAEAATMRKAIADDLVVDNAAANGSPTLLATAAANAKKLNDQLDHYVGVLATKKADAGDFKAYSEVNATVTGSVTAGGMTLSAGVSVDAGTGYDFADDDTFDGAKTNGVGLDSVSLDMGSAGKLTLNDDAITHMVDGDDDATGDVSYTNTFGGATFTAVMDLEKDDSDIAATKGTAGRIAVTADIRASTAATATSALIPAIAVGDWIASIAPVAADTQWSAKVAMPIGAGTVYVAMDEESGNAFGGSAVVSGMTLSIDSKLEALGSDIKSNRQNTIGVATTMGAVNGKFTYDSLKDGNQWGVSAGYTAGDISVAFATNEASSWSVTGGYALGTGASIKAGVNYTEDAFLGLSFAF